MSSRPRSGRHRFDTDRTTFPLETMTAQQREVFRTFLTAREEDRMNVNEPIWFALLLACERPAAEITIFGRPGDPDRPITAEKIATTFDLCYRWWADTLLHISRSSWRFDLLPTNSKTSDAYDRRLGCFYGYHVDDVEYYISSDDSRTMPADLVAEGIVSPEEVAYTTFVPQGHDDSVEGYKRAIETGKENRRTVADCADSWDLPLLETYADRRYQEALTDCTQFSFSESSSYSQ